MLPNKYPDIDTYIATFPESTQEKLQLLRETIRKIVPEAVESISYQMPAFKYKGSILAYFAGYKNHIGFYPMPSMIQVFEAEIAGYKHAKGSVQFPLDKELPLELITKMIQFRAEANEKKASLPAGKKKK